MCERHPSSMAGGASIRVVLASMPPLLQDIVRDLLAGDADVHIDEDVPSVATLTLSNPSPSTIIVIEADPRGFAEVCDMLPEVRLVAISRDGRHASVRFDELSRERLRQVIRCVAREEGV